MLKSKIKTHKVGTTYQQPHFFILNKGNNTGKPLPEYCANCFVFLADDDQDKDFHFYMFLGLWELRIFRPHLIGSVVPYIRLGDLVDLAEEAINTVNTGERSFMDVQPALAQIEAIQVRLQRQLRYLMQLRQAMFSRYLSR